LPVEIISLLAIAVLCFAAALLTSSLIVRWLPDGKTHDSHRFLSIDGVRGFLAFGVFIHHAIVNWYFLRTGVWQPPKINFVKQLGATSVAIFFMITAFLFWGRVLHSRDRMKWQSFFVSRVFRIYPLYMLVLAGVLIAVGHRTGWAFNESPVSVIREIGSWLVFHQPDINGLPSTSLVIAAVNWTLQYELWFYLALPLLAVAVVLSKPLWAKVICFLLAVGLFALFQLTPSVGVTFLGGVVGAYWVRSKRLQLLGQGPLPALIGMAAFSVVFFAAGRPYNPISLILLTVFFVVIASGNSLFGLLTSKSSLWLGEISYSIYLTHGLLLWVLFQNLVSPKLAVEHSFATLGAIAVALSPVVVILSSLSFLYLETPCITFGKKLLNGSARSPLAVATHGESNG
jgi:peptidoglycan/LPS O-acetylase OafA/YrhL